jgi:hypothetical protein
MDDIPSSRRKILQGSLVAPLVLTVSSASAQAVTSFTKCVANGQANQPSTSINIVQSQDQWFRCPVTVYPIYKGGSTSNFYGNYYRDSGIYKNVTNGQPLDLTSYTPGTGTTWYRLVYFGTDGSPKGAGWEKQTGGLAVTKSCGGSFAVCK